MKKIVRGIKYVHNLKRQLTDHQDFCKWLLNQVWDEENWELNAVALDEIILRKLAKLGYLKVVGDEWKRVK